MRKFNLLKSFALAFLPLLVSCSGETKKQETKEEKPLVRVESVSNTDVDQNYEFTATVEANVVNNIAPSIAVRIEDILVEVGDPVKKGQKLVQMDRSNLKQTKTQLDNMQIEFNRVDELYKVGGVSKSEWDAKKTQLEVTRSQYENLIENTQLISPINGIVTARNYDKGDMFALGSPVLVIEQITPVKLLINVSELFYTKVKKGMEAQIKLDVYGDESFNGKVSLIYPSINPQTRTFPVEITIPNSDQKVRSGMFARVTMNFGTLNHVVVPDLSVIKQSGSGDRFIYVYKDGKVSYNKVVLGQRLNDKYELISGVENGDQVVVAGQNRLNNGMEVEVEK